MALGSPSVAEMDRRALGEGEARIVVILYSTYDMVDDGMCTALCLSCVVGVVLIMAQDYSRCEVPVNRAPAHAVYHRCHIDCRLWTVGIVAYRTLEALYGVSK